MLYNESDIKISAGTDRHEAPLNGVTLSFLAYLYPGLRENRDECLFLS
ncbi:MAG TPA: hypothetical protein VGE90_07730 [Chitinophaga sp.]